MIAASQRSMVMEYSSRVVAEANIGKRRRQQPHHKCQPKQIFHQKFLELVVTVEGMVIHGMHKRSIVLPEYT